MLSYFLASAFTSKDVDVLVGATARARDAAMYRVFRRPDFIEHPLDRVLLGEVVLSRHADCMATVLRTKLTQTGVRFAAELNNLPRGSRG